MDIHEGIRTVGPCLETGSTLVLADVHIGAEESLNKQGYMIPRFQFQEMRGRLLRILEEAEYDTIVINGDLKHEFGTISQTEWDNTLKLIEMMSHHCKKVILLRGNHDTLLGPIAYKTSVEVKDHHIVGDIFICHGHRIPSGPDFEKSKVIIIGHEHPAVTFSKNGRTESFKCFLKGKYRGKDIVVMPSFNTLTVGSNVLSEKPLSPLLEKGTNDFEVFALGDTTYPFGKVSTLKDL